MICNRCENKIHSGKIEKIITNTGFGQEPIVKAYCRHCYAAVRYGQA